jgi:[acyl-carrier-protein] S-malonyltransferase
MLAVIGAEAEVVVQLCADAREQGVLSPANFNCPGQIVIAGHRAAIERAEKLAKERKLRAIPLKVSAPFHCALMRPAAQHVQRALELIRPAALSFPVISNVEAEPNQRPERVAELLVRQIDGAVLWEQTLRKLGALGVTHALEIGPGQVLAGLARKTDKSLKVHSVSDLSSLRAVAEFLAT